MVIEIAKIDANPFRNLDRYKIDRTKVEKLKSSIDETGFWDNLVVRPAGDRFQLAYGHHRLIALQEIGFLTVDVPVKELDDKLMLKIMANENLEEWKLSTSVIVETVSAVREFIAREVGDCRKWEDLSESIQWLFENQDTLNGSMNTPSRATTSPFVPGEGLIHKFLGEAWTSNSIRDALRLIEASTPKDETQVPVSRKATETFTVPAHAKAFSDTVQTINKSTSVPISEEEQEEIVEEIQKEAEETGVEEFSSATIRHKVVEKFQEKGGAQKKQRDKSAAPIVKSAYWVDIVDALGNARNWVNKVHPIHRAPEDKKEAYREKAQAIIDILMEKMEDSIDG